VGALIRLDGAARTMLATECTRVSSAAHAVTWAAGPPLGPRAGQCGIHGTSHCFEPCDGRRGYGRRPRHSFAPQDKGPTGAGMSDHAGAKLSLHDTPILPPLI